MTKRAVSLAGSPSIAWLERPVSRAGMVLLAALIAAAPWVLFFDPIAGFRRAHIPRDPSAIYRLYSDDFAYVAASRTLPRTLANLFMPHNAHIVPAWRVLTWALVAWSGSLVKLPAVLAQAAYGILVAVMLMTARLVARETGRAGLGLAAMAAVGTTSVMASPACWYSAGQTLWAGFGILATLWYAQCWRRWTSIAALVLAAISAALAGWFWTIGYMAGPVAAVYLWLDGRRRCRLAAAVPLCASVLALLTAMALGGGKIDSTVSFHGRTPGEAARPVEGLLHTAQAIPENLILGNLGLKAQTTPAQGVMISLILLGLWAFHRGRDQGIRAFNSLECAGAALVLGSYLVEWTVRGYLPFRSLRTISLGMIVPWYDVVPQIGAVLFVAGWCSGPRSPGSRPAVLRPIAPLSRLGAIGVIGLMAVLLVLNRPRVDLLWRNWVPPLSRAEEKKFPILALQSLRAHWLLLDRADWQRRHLRRLDQAQEVAARLGIGRDGIRAAFGRLDMPELPDVYDAAGLLVLPERGRLTDQDTIRRALAPYVFMESEPRPPWLPADEPWPPHDLPHWSESDVDVSE
ncbi:MAG: hypothetical protein ACXVCF_12595 [Isosphaeraceae bacterium]